MRANRSHIARLLAFRQPISRLAYNTIAVGSVLGLIGVWLAISSSGIIQSSQFPPPGAVARAAVAMFTHERFLIDILASAARIGVAFLVAALLAVPLGILMSCFKSIEALCEPAVDFVRYVPVPALLPLFVLFSGIGETPKFLVLFMGTFFQLVLIIMDDADNVPKQNLEIARTLGASQAQLIRDVLIPSLLPQIYDRLRVMLGWCWTYLVIAELVNVENGVGHVIKEAQRFSAADKLFVCCIVLGLIGLLTDYAAKLGYRSLFPYATKSSLQAR